MPNDDLEKAREEWKHELIKYLLGNKLYLAPVSDHPQKILDLGTGSGLWAIAGTLDHATLTPFACRLMWDQILTGISGREVRKCQCYRGRSFKHTTILGTFQR